MIAEGVLWRSVTVLAGAVIDGDTLRVQTATPLTWGADLGRLRLDPAGAVTLRLAALDAPERHYPSAPPGLDHQPMHAALDASRALEHAVGDRLPCRLTIRVHGVDRYGRALAMLWRPEQAPSPREDGDPAALKGCINAGLLASGVAYPDFHPGLPAAWVEQLARQVAQARAVSLGLWAWDRTASGIDLADPRAICQDCLVLPRLFRRLADFQALQAAPAGPVPPAARLREFLEQREVPVRLRSGGPARPFAEFVQISDNILRIAEPVENFLYQSGFTEHKLT